MGLVDAGKEPSGNILKGRSEFWLKDCLVEWSQNSGKGDIGESDTVSNQKGIVKEVAIQNRKDSECISLGFGSNGIVGISIAKDGIEPSCS